MTDMPTTNEEQPVQTASQEIEALSTKRPRRKLSDEERIAERKAEIDRIQARGREKVYDLVDDGILCLRGAQEKARRLEMADQCERITAALRILETIQRS